MPAIAYAHVEIRDGVPYLTGTQTKVIEVALDHIAHGWDAEEMHRQHPHLSLGQLHGALAFYFDHQEELDRDIEQRERKADELRAELDSSPMLREKLRACGLLP